LGVRTSGQTVQTARALYIGLISLVLVVLAAGFNVSYLVLVRADSLLYTAVGLYLLGLVFLAGVSLYVLVNRIRL